MENTQSSTVLQRKANAARHEAQARSMSPAKALRLSFAKAAEELFELPLTVTGVLQEAILQDRMLKAITDGQLLVMLDGPGGRLGAMAIDFQLVAGLIEMQTIGCVHASAAKPRVPTQTDAAMLAPLIDAALSGAAANLAGTDDAQNVAGFRFGVMVESRRMLELMLVAPIFDSFQMNVELSGGAKQGEMVLMLPQYVPEGGQAKSADNCDEARVDLRATVMNVPTQIDAVLCRLRLPLSRARGLRVGDSLPLPPGVLDDIALEAGRTLRLSGTRLGQLNGFRALRMMRDENTVDGSEEEWEEDPALAELRRMSNLGSAGITTEVAQSYDPATPHDNLPELDELTPEEMEAYGLTGDVAPEEPGSDEIETGEMPGLLSPLD